MEKIIIEIETKNSAFDDNVTEVHRILELLTEYASYHILEDVSLHDINGNTCGSVKIEE